MVAVPALAAIRLTRDAALMNAIIAAPVFENVKFRRPTLRKRPECRPGARSGFGGKFGAHLEIAVRNLKFAAAGNQPFGELEDVAFAICDIAPLRGQVQSTATDADIIVHDIAGVLRIVVAPRAIGAAP